MKLKLLIAAIFKCEFYEGSFLFFFWLPPQMQWRFHSCPSGRSTYRQAVALAPTLPGLDILTGTCGNLTKEILSFGSQ